MDVAQHKLVGLLDELLRRAVIFTTIHERRLGGTFEHAALHDGTHRLITREDRIGMSGNQLSLMLGEHTPRKQLIECDRFDRFGSFGRVRLSRGGHGCAQRFDVLSGSRQTRADRLIEASVAALEHQLLDGRGVGFSRGSRDPHEYAMLKPHRFDEIRALMPRRDLRHDHGLPIDVLQGNIGNDQRFAAIRNGIGYGVHDGEHVGVVDAHHIQGFVGDAEDDAAALAVGEGDGGFGVFDAAIRQGYLELHVLGLAIRVFV